MGRYSEETLTNYFYAVSNTEAARIENAKTMIKNAINDSNEFLGIDYEIFEQGSYANNTNIKFDSDIDICVMLKKTLWTITYGDYKQRIIRALNKKFGTDIKIGNKSIKINSNSYRVKADVVVAFQYRNYKILNSRDANLYIEGIKLISNSNEIVINYPKKHIENGITKNKETSFMYKKLVRIFKNIKSNMIDAGIVNIDTISSFLIEALIWKIPNEEITSYDTLDKTVRNTICYLLNKLDKKQCDSWTEPSKCVYLFHSNRKWTQDSAKDFLLKMWRHMEYK